MKKPAEKTFWITNVSGRNVTLSDLYISVPAQSSVNLLDKKHYNFTEEQLRKSQASGSIFKKRDKISVRRVPPQMIPKSIIEVDPSAVLPVRTLSIYEITYENYEELNVTDDALIEGSKLETENSPPINNNQQQEKLK